MRLQLRAGLQLAWRRPGRLQVGLDPRHGVILDGVTAGDEALVSALAQGTTLPQLLGVATRTGVPHERAHALVATLQSAGSLAAVPTVRSRLARVPDELRERMAVDATVLGLAHPDGDGWHVLAARRSRCVAVLGAGRTGLGVALGVASAGVGCVLVEDAAAVQPGDQQPGGYAADDVGRPREEAARDVLARLCPSTRTTVRGRTCPDLVVLVAAGPLDPARAHGLLQQDLAHLAVVWGERDVAVGPLVVPGSSSCLTCQHLHRTDRDPDWPRLVAELSGGARRPFEEGSMAAVAAAVATSQVLAHLDEGAVPVTLDATLETALPGGAVAVRAWPPHPRCGCRGLPGVPQPVPAGTMIR
jgi:hypothetical protein